MNKIILAFSFLLVTLTLSGAAGEAMTINAQSGILLWSEPDQSSSMVSALSNGAKVVEIERTPQPATINGITAVWIHVRYGSISGWLFSGQLDSYHNQASGLFFSNLRKHISAGRVVKLSGGLDFSGLTYSEYRVSIKLKANGTFIREFTSSQGDSAKHGTYQMNNSLLILVYKNMSRATERYVYIRNWAGKEGLVPQGQIATNEPKLIWTIQ